MTQESYRRYLETIAASKRELGRDLQPPCTEEGIRALRAEARADLSAEIPDDYAHFLRVTDGLNSNGVYIYASRKTLLLGHRDLYIGGFVEMNQIWREETDPDGNYLFYADADLDLYGYNLKESRYELITKDSGDTETMYNSFNEMLAAALRYSVEAQILLLVKAQVGPIHRLALDAPASPAGKPFSTSLYEKTIFLPDVVTRLFEYYKRPRNQFSDLRDKFRSTVSTEFLKKISNDPENILQLQRAGLTEAEIQEMRRGKPPNGYQVHHKLSLDDTGTNDLDNLILVKLDPFHKALTAHQRSWRSKLKPGTSGEGRNATNTATILWPEFKQGVIVYGSR